MVSRISVVDYLVLADPPHLRAHECVSCSATYLDRRNACARCGNTAFGSRDLSNDGWVRAFTIVHRASSSVPAPFTSVVVDLDGGGVVKANLLDPPPVAEITPRLPVTLDTFTWGVDDDGVEAVGFGYRVRSR